MSGLEELHDLVRTTQLESTKILKSLQTSLLPSTPPLRSSASPPTFSITTSTILSDLRQLIAGLTKQSTNFSLAIKPVLSVDAALGTLKELGGLVWKVAFCVGLLGEKGTEGLLRKEIWFVALFASVLRENRRMERIVG